MHLAGLDPWILLCYQDHAIGSAAAIRTLVIRAYQETLDVRASAIRAGNVQDSLGIPVIEPIFQIRR